MIIKEKDPVVGTLDARRRAGDEAERQMAFYLQREFGNDEDVRVINDLRLQRNGDFAQIDHLVIHGFGVAIIESKSVCGSLEVNDHGEFVRIFDRRREGMPSPIEQARRQAKLLADLLQDHAAELLDSGILRTRDFSNMPVSIYAAISDHAVIKRSRQAPQELAKADSVCHDLREQLKAWKRAAGAKGFVRYLIADKNTSQELLDNAPRFTFKPEEVERVSFFLLERHEPLPVSGAPRVSTVAPLKRPIKPAAPPTGAVSRLKCRDCGKLSTDVVYGKYGYYLKCRDCDGNTPIDLACTKCRSRGRVRKEGPLFFRECGCGESELIHTNA